jgi:NTP pyrophosphatase (non-canonical NTP hydrolase)
VLKLSFQLRVGLWARQCFGPEIASDPVERNHRFLEEAVEVVQANNCTRAEAHRLVDYVFDRPEGDLRQEVGGALVTLAALCCACDVDMDFSGETELQRITDKIEHIRAKRLAKSDREAALKEPSPLP